MREKHQEIVDAIIDWEEAEDAAAAHERSREKININKQQLEWSAHYRAQRRMQAAAKEAKKAVIVAIYSEFKYDLRDYHTEQVRKEEERRAEQAKREERDAEYRKEREKAKAEKAKTEKAKS